MKIQLRVVYGNLKFLQYAEKSFTCIICYVSTWRIKQSEMGIAFHSSIHQSFEIFVRLVVKIVVIASLSSSSVSIFDIPFIGFHIALELYLWIFFAEARVHQLGSLSTWAQLTWGLCLHEDQLKMERLELSVQLFCLLECKCPLWKELKMIRFPKVHGWYGQNHQIIKMPRFWP